MNIRLKLSDRHYPAGSDIFRWEVSKNSNCKSDIIGWEVSGNTISSKIRPLHPKLDFWVIDHQTGWNLDTRVTSTQRTSFQKRFLPNPKIFLSILDELKNLSFRGGDEKLMKSNGIEPCIHFKVRGRWWSSLSTQIYGRNRKNLLKSRSQKSGQKYLRK
jgi:hypothetical protein